MRPHTALLLATLLGCGRAKEGVKDAINKGGEIAGQTAGEFIKGAKEGVEETFAVPVELGERPRDLGITTGQIRATAAPDGGERTNVLELYLIHAKEVTDTLLAKAYDADGLEIGRARLPLHAAANSAGWCILTFPEQTDLESKGKVVLE